MFKRKPSLKGALIGSFIAHSAVLILFSIATVKEFYPQPRYLEVSLGAPRGMRYVHSTSFRPIERAAYHPKARIPANFFYRVRKASLEIALTHPQGNPGVLKPARQIDSPPSLFLGSSREAEDWTGNQDILKILRVVSPESQYLMQKIAIEREVKLRVHLSPDGRVSWVEMNTSSGNALLDGWIKKEIARWQFIPLYHHD